jgi:HK97 gp10 family phage protein
LSAQTDRLRRRMRAIPQAVREAVVPALVLSGNELAGRMRALAPERTGALKESIVATPPGASTPPYSQPGGSRVAGELEAIVTAGSSEVRYPHLVEFGTANATAQPFFFPAYRLSRKRIAGRLKRAIRKAVREGWRA